MKSTLTALAFVAALASAQPVLAQSAAPTFSDSPFVLCLEDAGVGLGTVGAQACWMAQRNLVARGVEITEDNVIEEMQSATAYFDSKCLEKVMMPQGELIETTYAERQSCRIG